MDQESKQSIDINSANEETLTELQGVGARLAKRIKKARPFSDIDDLSRVRGISNEDVDRLRPYLTISVAPEDLQDESEDQQVLEESPDTENMDLADTSDEGKEMAEKSTTLEEIEHEEINKEPEVTDDIVDPENEDVDTSDDNMDGQASILTETETEEDQTEDLEVETIDGPDQDQILEEYEPIDEPTTEKLDAKPVYMTRGGACSLILIGGFFTLILAVAVTLGILASMNQGRLDYASPSQITVLQSQNETLSTQTQILADDINGLRTRMDNLESLSGQVSDMEAELSTQQEEIAEIQAQIIANQAAYDELVVQLEDIDEEIQILTVQSERSEGFLEGLQTLMEGLFPQDSEVEETP